MNISKLKIVKLKNLSKKKQINNIKKIRKISVNYFNKVKYSAIADTNRVIYINPYEVNCQLKNEKRKRKNWICGEIAGGDWDLDVNYRYSDNDVGYKSIYDHFINGIPWEYTERFKSLEPERLKRKGEIRGCKTLAELAKNFYNRVDPLYENIKNEGLKPPVGGTGKVNPIYVYIGRNGEIIYSGNGNHRLHIAKVLGIKKFPVLVMRRHKHWQKIREKTKKSLIKGHTVDYDLKKHPDLQDIFEICNL